MENAPKRPTDAAGQCLLLLPPGYEAPTDLLSGLRKRGVQVREVNDAPAAMLALARQRYLSLVIVEPDSLMQAGELAAAAHRYHAATTVWRYAAADEPRLMRWPGEAVPAQPADRQPVAACPPAEPAPVAPSYDAGERDPAPMPDIEITLSEEELAMLLADDDPPA